MKIVVTGADRPLGALLCHNLSLCHDLVPVGAAEQGAPQGYRCADLRAPEQAVAVLHGAQAVLHTLPFDPPPQAGAESELLDWVARSTYVLVQAACQRGIGRLVLTSRLALFEDYPADHVVGTDWAPLPRAEAASLAPYMAELVCREIARTGKLEVICLRLGDLDQPEGTNGAEAVRAAEEALVLDRQERGHYHWTIRHVSTAGRFTRQRRRG